MRTNTKDYDAFIAGKVKQNKSVGFEPAEIAAPLFDWQKAVVRWAIRTGRAALFEDCGLGKTLQQLEWARQVAAHTSAPVLILTPLAVAHQTAAEAAKFGIPARVASAQSDVSAGAGVWITNYDKLEHFDPSAFSGVVLDESSILKAFTGKTRIMLTDAFAGTPYRLCCTATPSPNDYTEFGQHAAFLGVCSPAQMLATFFVNDTFNTGDWRLKKHAESAFWQWVASWACCVSRPSDIGFKDDGYNLPALHMHTEMVEVDERATDGEELFRHATLSATTIHAEMRMTSEARAARVASLVNNSAEPWIVWCNTNDEADHLIKAIPHAVEVRGSDHPDFKEAAVDWFLGAETPCQLSRFSAKFAGWINHTLRTTTEKTETSGLPNRLSGSAQTPTSESDTCGHITPQTRSSGESEAPSSAQSTTPSGELITPQTSTFAKRSSSRSGVGSSKTPTKEKRSESKNTTLAKNSLTQCCNLKAAAAPSAAVMAEEENQSSHLLTTAMQPDECADCCAARATSELESSETIPTCSEKRPIMSGRVLISKGSIFGYGLNLQHCARVAFVGLSYSFEDFYQALRRCYRFGQKREVRAYIVQAKTEGAILQTIQRKIEQHKNMQEQMKQASAVFAENRIKELSARTETTHADGDGWRLYHGDCVRVARQIPSDSVDFSVFSPPFADLFTYSNDLQDMGNCSDLSEFTRHFEILIAEIARITVPGREVAVHCVDLLSTKWKHGKIQFQDFSGEIIRAFWKHDFLFHSRICIWKSPVTEMQRTKAHGLLYKTLKADSCDSRVGCADYLLVFRKPGENPRPVTKNPDQYPVDWWQEVASPVWMTVDQGRVLNGEGARDNADERHICPLQLDVIERAVTLWSNPGDLVYSPFAGIGSEGYQSLKLGRRFVGSELKESYFKQACLNLKNAKAQQELFA